MAAMLPLLLSIAVRLILSRAYLMNLASSSRPKRVCSFSYMLVSLSLLTKAHHHYYSLLGASFVSSAYFFAVVYYVKLGCSMQAAPPLQQ